MSALNIRASSTACALLGMLKAAMKMKRLLLARSLGSRMEKTSGPGRSMRRRSPSVLQLIMTLATQTHARTEEAVVIGGILIVPFIRLLPLSATVPQVIQVKIALRKNLTAMKRKEERVADSQLAKIRMHSS